MFCFSFSLGSLSDDTFVRTRRFYLPPSFRYIAWFLSFVIGFGSGFITVYYSKDFQEGKYSLWLQAIFVTFLFCTFIIQPLGILFKAMGTALVYRRDPTVLQHFPDRYEEDIEEIRQRFTHLTDEDEITRGKYSRVVLERFVYRSVTSQYYTFSAVLYIILSLQCIFHTICVVL